MEKQWAREQRGAKWGKKMGKQAIGEVQGPEGKLWVREEGTGGGSNMDVGVRRGSNRLESIVERAQEKYMDEIENKTEHGG